MAVLRSPAAETTTRPRLRSQAPRSRRQRRRRSRRPAAGRVTGTEAGDEESAYEVEVTLPDGSQVDVQLDEAFDVVGSKDDGRDQDEQGDN